MTKRKTYPRNLLLTGALLLTVGSPEGHAATGLTADTSLPITHEENNRVPKGAAWTEHYFPSSDGSKVELHADVLLPKGLAPGQKVPVILSVGTYFGHSGGIQLENHKQTGPSTRFTVNDLSEGTKLFERGYALVMVDLRGFGGSTGCSDLIGPGEQADVKAAIDWAAKQPWSTGAVGMYGKSNDAITGLVGNNLNQDALKAVVAQEPIWDLSRNFRSNGVPRTTTVNIANTYNTIATLPQMPDDTARYRANAEYEKTHPECGVQNIADYQIADPQSEYWKVRDLAAQAKGSDTPLLITQGFLEWNTEPEGMQEYLDNHQGPERGWLGQWDHVRGNDRTPDGRLAMGRAGWFEEVISFYDQYLKGIQPTVKYPAYAVQDSTGAWRAQDTWPVVERSATIPLGNGSYMDDGVVADAKAKTPNRFYVWSKPLQQSVRLTGTPKVAFKAEGHGNVMVELYDVAPDGRAVAFNRQVSLVKPGMTGFDLRSTDWILATGHSLAVEIGTIQPGFFLEEDWLDTPSFDRITVRNARLELALDDPSNDRPLPGSPAPWLELYRLGYAAKLSPGTPTFTLPAPGR